MFHCLGCLSRCCTIVVAQFSSVDFLLRLEAKNGDLLGQKGLFMSGEWAADRTDNYIILLHCDSSDGKNT